MLKFIEYKHNGYIFEDEYGDYVCRYDDGDWYELGKSNNKFYVTFQTSDENSHYLEDDFKKFLRELKLKRILWNG